MDDLRRTAATLLQEIHVLRPVIEAVLNHIEPNLMKLIYGCQYSVSTSLANR